MKLKKAFLLSGTLVAAMLFNTPSNAADRSSVHGANGANHSDGSVLISETSAFHVGLTAARGHNTVVFTSYDLYSSNKRHKTGQEYVLLRLNIPLSYLKALRDSDEPALSPLIAREVYSRNPGIMGYEAVPGPFLSKRPAAQRDIVSLNGFVGALDENPDYGLSFGVLLKLGK